MGEQALQALREKLKHPAMQVLSDLARGVLTLNKFGGGEECPLVAELLAMSQPPAPPEGTELAVPPVCAPPMPAPPTAPAPPPVACPPAAGALMSKTSAPLPAALPLQRYNSAQLFTVRAPQIAVLAACWGRCWGRRLPAQQLPEAVHFFITTSPDHQSPLQPFGGGGPLPAEPKPGLPSSAKASCMTPGQVEGGPIAAGGACASPSPNHARPGRLAATRSPPTPRALPFRQGFEGSGPSVLRLERSSSSGLLAQVG